MQLFLIKFRLFSTRAISDLPAKPDVFVKVNAAPLLSQRFQSWTS